MATPVKLSPRKSRFRRRFFVGFSLLMLSWMIAVQAGCLAMRTSDKAWVTKLTEKGQLAQPVFSDIPSAADGRTIHAVSIQQSSDLPVVLMVHGSPGSADAYLDYLSDTTLTRQAQVISIDRPGFGYTSGFGKPEPSLEKQAAAIKAVLDSLAPGKKAILVGHSLGCPVAVCAAIHYPNLVAGLVLLGASVDPALEPDYWWQSTVDNPPVCWFIPKSLWTSNAEIIPLRGELEAMIPLWSQITCPVTMIHAHDDRLVEFGNGAFSREKLVNSTRFDTLIFDKGDHFVVWTQHDKVRKAILDLLLYAK